MTTKTTNIFTATLGKKAIKWDAFWHLFEWLLNDEGHGLGVSIRSELISFAFGQALEPCSMRREHPVCGQTDGKGKWTDLALGIPSLNTPTHLIVMDDIGAAASEGQRKLMNLRDYMSQSQGQHPNASVRAIVISDVAVNRRLKAVVYEHLGHEATEHVTPAGWRLLPLHTIGDWVDKALAASASTRTCDLYGRDQDGNRVLEGRVVMKGKALSGDPTPGHENQITEILSRKNVTAEGGIDPVENPKAWFEALPAMYQGTYLWAEMAERDRPSEKMAMYFRILSSGAVNATSAD